MSILKRKSAKLDKFVAKTIPILVLIIFSGVLIMFPYFIQTMLIINSGNIFRYGQGVERT